ncbi:MAG: N-acyl amino acid synthase FeeM domain-containing protein, partial [Mycobacteriales bacterium]
MLDVALAVRPALPSEHAAVGALTADAYVTDGLVGPDYAEVLRDAADRAATATVLVAVLDGELVGTVT